MCGLFGFVSAALLDEGTIARADIARDTLSLRGPDNAGRFVDGGLYIGHRRLSIIDTSEHGNQPMVDHGVVLTVNGEVYNFKALRQELENEGAAFKSGSDSEVILHGYKKWGIEALAEKLDGMYVAIIFDRDLGRLHILRDRVGIKPLYYYYDGKNFVYASELKAIQSFIGLDALVVDPEAIIDFLTYRFIPAPKSLYKNVFKVSPASIVSLDVNDVASLDIKTYWQLSGETSFETDNDLLARQLCSLLSESVEEQLVSDVPLGVLLSGGIDSSAIAAFAAKVQPKLKSFTMGFENAAQDESKYAQAVSSSIGTEHHASSLRNEEMGGVVGFMADMFDEPFGDTSALPTYRVSKFAREQVTVALSGDGGDELFGGYNWYKNYDFAMSLGKKLPCRFMKGLPFKVKHPRLKKYAMAFIKDPLEMYASIRGAPHYSIIKAWKKKLGVAQNYDHLWAYRKHYNQGYSPIRNARIMDFHTYLPDDILVKVDRASMAVSLECRPPFLSKKLVEFAFQLPEGFVMLNGQLKGGLKYALRDVLSNDILHRKKQGFSVPDFGWRTDAVKNYGSVQEYLLQPFLDKDIKV